VALIRRGVTMQEEEIKQHLMASSPEYQRLINEHHQFEDRLKELQSHHHLSDQDLIEEAKIKKRKLHLKDEMNALIENFRNELSHQHS
jgi:uncharacterized protein YdcH (DUF465 family)